ncbi:MAG: hypothetical protein WDW38_005468 [Sanguina aurantia]
MQSTCPRKRLHSRASKPKLPQAPALEQTPPPAKKPRVAKVKEKTPMSPAAVLSPSARLASSKFAAATAAVLAASQARSVAAAAATIAASTVRALHTSLSAATADAAAAEAAGSASGLAAGGGVTMEARVSMSVSVQLKGSVVYETFAQQQAPAESSLLLDLGDLVQGTLLRRPSATCRTPYVADILLPDGSEVMAHCPALDGAGMIMPGGKVFLSANAPKTKGPKTVTTHAVQRVSFVPPSPPKGLICPPVPPRGSHLSPRPPPEGLICPPVPHLRVSSVPRPPPEGLICPPVPHQRAHLFPRPPREGSSVPPPPQEGLTCCRSSTLSPSPPCRVHAAQLCEDMRPDDGRALVGAHPYLGEKLAQLLVEGRHMPGLGEYCKVEGQRTFGNCRVDFVVTKEDGSRILLEAKNVVGRGGCKAGGWRLLLAWVEP